MSTVHQSPHWPACKSTLSAGSYVEPQSKYHLSSFTPLKKNTITILTFHADIQDDVLKNIETCAVNKINSGRGSYFFTIDPINLINEKVEELLNAPLDARVVEVTGLSHQEWKTCINIAANLVRRFYPSIALDGKPVFQLNHSSQDVEKWKKEMVIASSNFAYTSLGAVQSHEKISFSEEDLKLFNVEKKAVKQDPQKMSCLAFALLQMKELQAQDLIFSGHNDDRLDGIVPQLINWGYRAVKTPDEGDLVIYLVNDKPVHAGVYTESGKVHSKLGRQNPYSHQHKLFDILPNLGNQVVFFRKPAFSLGQDTIKNP